MKVLLINGSPHKKGSTFTALSEIAKQLTEEGVESEIMHIGTKPISGCLACGMCSSKGKCVINDVVNEAVAKAKEADGLIFGAPVYFASPNGSMVSFLDRFFYSAPSEVYKFKPAACITVAAHAGATATYDMLNKYLGINSMVQIPSIYWNMAYGNNAEETLKDAKGMKIMRTLGKNMAWMLKVLENAKENNISLPY